MASFTVSQSVRDYLAQWNTRVQYSLNGSTSWTTVAPNWNGVMSDVYKGWRFLALNPADVQIFEFYFIKADNTRIDFDLSKSPASWDYTNLATITPFDATDIVELVAVMGTEPPEPTPDYYFSQSDVDALATINAKGYVNDVEITDGAEAFEDDIIRFEISEGYVFFDDSGRPSTTFAGWIGGVYSYIPWTYADNVKENGTVVEGPLQPVNGSFDYDLIVNAEIRSSIIGKNNVYQLDDADHLTAISAERFQYIGDGEFVDYGGWILSVLNLPLPIPEENKGNVRPVYLGDYRTDVDATQLNVDKLWVDLGEISTPSKFDDGREWENVDVQLFLPYFNPRTVPPEYVLGQTVRIGYEVDLYTGNCRVLLDTDVLDEVFELFTGSMGVALPVANSGHGAGEVVLSQEVELGTDNGIYRPFIEVQRRLPVIEDERFNAVELREGPLSEATGLVEMEQGDLRIESATLRELFEIEVALKDGVLIGE